MVGTKNDKSWMNFVYLFSLIGFTLGFYGNIVFHTVFCMNHLMYQDLPFFQGAVMGVLITFSVSLLLGMFSLSYLFLQDLFSRDELPLLKKQ